MKCTFLQSLAHGKKTQANQNQNQNQNKTLKNTLGENLQLFVLTLKNYFLNILLGNHEFDFGRIYVTNTAFQVSFTMYMTDLLWNR